MDTSRFKRREIQTRRQTKQNNFGFSDIVPKTGLPRPKLENTRSQSHTPRPVTTPVRIAVQTPTQQPNNAQPQPITSTPASTSPIDMGLPGGPSSLKYNSAVVTKTKIVGFRKIALRGAIAAFVLVLIGSGLIFSQGYWNAHKVFKGNASSAAALTKNVNPNLLKGEGDGRINILMLGRGGGTHDAPDLTDTIMLASIDPVNHTSTLLSIPRDLWVDIPNQGAMKINAAWETGEFKYLHKVSPGSNDPQAIQSGFDLVDQTVESILGVPINYNVLVDFQAFKQAVDTINGVAVNVPTDLVDPTMAWENHNNSILAKAGLQTFNGKQALTYVRSRETTSDFARSERQRSVMLALKGKVETLGTLSNPIKIAGLMNTFGDNVKTDLSMSDASRLYSIFKNINDTDTKSVGFADKENHFITTGNMNGQSIDLPTAGLFNYSAIQSFIRTQLIDGYIIKEKAKVLVLNGTQQVGLATAKAEELKSYGYNIVGVANAPTIDWTQSAIVDLSKGKGKYTVNYLQQRFNVTATKNLPDAAIQPNGADFVIIIGSDETPTSKI